VGFNDVVSRILKYELLSTSTIWQYVFTAEKLDQCSSNHELLSCYLKSMNLMLVRAILSFSRQLLSVLKQSYLLLIDPVVLNGLPFNDFTLVEPESDLLLGILDAVGAVAYVATDIDGVITTHLFVSM
jgi:hypothetical protein